MIRLPPMTEVHIGGTLLILVAVLVVLIVGAVLLAVLVRRD